MGSSGSKDFCAEIIDVKRAIKSNIRELDRQILAAERNANELVRRMKYKHANNDIEGAKSLAQEIQNNRKVMASFKSTKSQCTLLLSKVITAHSMNKLTDSVKKSCILLKRDNMNLEEFQKILNTLEMHETQDSIKQELIEEALVGNNSFT